MEGRKPIKGAQAGTSRSQSMQDTPGRWSGDAPFPISHQLKAAMPEQYFLVLLEKHAPSVAVGAVSGGCLLCTEVISGKGNTALGFYDHNFGAHKHYISNSGCLD